MVSRPRSITAVSRDCDILFLSWKPSQHNMYLAFSDFTWSLLWGYPIRSNVGYIRTHALLILFTLRLSHSPIVRCMLRTHKVPRKVCETDCLGRGSFFTPDQSSRHCGSVFWPLVLGPLSLASVFPPQLLLVTECLRQLDRYISTLVWTN